VKALRDVFGDKLSELAQHNPSIVVLDADLANSTKFEWHSKVAATGELEVARRELQIEEVTK